MSRQSQETTKRPYRKRRRAEHEAETRLRITEAAVALHGTLGPARTTISAVAEQAGVQRGTVYRHFPTEEDLFGACSAHWGKQHPLPDLAAWVAIDDPDERLLTALRETYAWFGRGEAMLEKTSRDAPLVPAMSAARNAMRSWFDAAAETVVRGRPERGAARRRVEAAIAHGLAFDTWRSLVREQGLSEADAVTLMARLVRVAGATSRAGAGRRRAY